MNFSRRECETIINKLKSIKIEDCTTSITAIESLLEQDSAFQNPSVVYPNEPTFILPNEFLQIKCETTVDNFFNKHKPKSNFNYIEYNSNLDSLIDILDNYSIKERSEESEIYDNPEKLNEVIKEFYQ
ncbi:hypothetical protein A0H76_601 [Hepatospora eriocheir]|uniref:Uncharacterized protein n=1 Tax=Hepatospora eriocheir TaxID=1081669 RepID=A0A1X0QL44_9MICR|nr:hypothetical protein A0H76_601 [Hepatospora eriocheir]